MGNSDWASMFPTAKCHYLLYEGSDHRLFLSVFDPTKLKSHRLFQYDRRLGHSLEFKALVDKIWKENDDLEVMIRISKCRKAITRWSRDKYLNSKNEIDRLKLSLDSELSEQTADDLSISSLNLALLKAYSDEEEYW